jgi:hypothetical protein
MMRAIGRSRAGRVGKQGRKPSFWRIVRSAGRAWLTLSPANSMCFQSTQRVYSTEDPTAPLPDSRALPVQPPFQHARRCRQSGAPITAELHTALLRCGKRGFGASRDHPSFKFGNSRHPVHEKRPVAPLGIGRLIQWRHLRRCDCHGISKRGCVRFRALPASLWSTWSKWPRESADVCPSNVNRPK